MSLKSDLSSLRFQTARLNTAKAVQLRDAKPLQAIQDLLSRLDELVNAEGSCLFLAVEEDVPIAMSGRPCPLLTLDKSKEAALLSGCVVEEVNFYGQPIRIGGLSVAYVLLYWSNDPPDFNKDLIAAYGELISKELEIADKMAVLEYQNEQVSRKQKQLEKAISFKNNILSLTTHDLRSPLSAIQGFLELMQEEFNEQAISSTIKEYHKTVKKGVDDVSEMVEQLHEIALLELERMELNTIKVDVNWLVQEVCDLHQAKALSKKQVLTFESAPKPIYVEVDIAKAKRIVANLIGNAIKYTRDHGKIHVCNHFQHGQVEIKVIDNGVGIPSQKIETIFEPFQKLKASGTKGEASHGLGLFISRYLAELFKGHIAVESELEKGSVFSLCLPATKPNF